MEFGLIPVLEEFEFNSQQKTQIVNASKELREVQEEPDIKEVIKQEQKESIEESKDVKKRSGFDFSKYQEYALTNLNFGFNNESHDFFVKAIRGSAENQYPTDEMMKLKAYFMQQNSLSEV